MRSLVQLLAAVAAFSTAAVVRPQDEDQDWPRWHIGIAVGSSEMGPDYGSFGLPEDWPRKETTTGQKFVAGFRPTRVIGVELQFLNFGEGDIDTGTRNNFVNIENHPLATVLSALLFVPEPVPWADVYGKVGVAVLEESLFLSGYTRSYEDPRCGPSFCQFDINQTESRPYIGIGARFEVARRGIGVRVEYEAVDRDDIGDPVTMLSVGIAWER